MSDDFNPNKTAWVLDEADLDHLMLVIDECDEVVFDLETTGLDEHATRTTGSNGGVPARIVLASFTLPSGTDEPSTFLLPLSHPDSPWMGSWRKVMARVAEQIAECEKPTIGHNLRFDLKWVHAATTVQGVPENLPVFDKEDADLFEKGHISNTGYWRIYEKDGPTSGIAAHDIIANRALGPKPEGFSVDHWNRDRLDNRRANLRYVDRSEQMRNRESWGESGIRGAYRLPSGRYEAAVTVNKKRVYLGTYPTAEEAGQAVIDFQGRTGDTPPESVRACTGVDLSDTLGWDTKISSHLLDETRSTKLKERAPDTFGVERWDDFDLTYPGAAEDVPLFDLGLYAARDTYWTWRLSVDHRERLGLIDRFEPESAEDVEHLRLGHLATWVAMPTSATLTEIEQRGMRLDAEWVRDELDAHLREADALKETLSLRYPEMDPTDASFAPTSTWFRQWSEHAVEAGDLTIAELTPTGKPRWSKGVLVRQGRAGKEVASMLLDYRDHAKKAEFLTSWLQCTTPANRIHTSYNDGSVATGRLSSSSPNMQQVTKALKPAFVPQEGWVFAELDYSQIELRVAAFISRCEPMIEAFQRGDDLHTLLAARITGKDPSEVTPTERQAGKSANFGLLYGMGPYGFREYAETVYGVSFTLEEATQVHTAFFEMWDGVGDWHIRAAARARATGQIVSPIGRVRRLPGIWDENEETVAYAERSAINSPVQGFASDLMQIAAASIAGRIPGHARVDDARLVGTVHDSILVEVPRDRWREAALECRERMLGVSEVVARLGCTLDVPLAAEIAAGTRWGLSDVGEVS